MVERVEQGEGEGGGEREGEGEEEGEGGERRTGRGMYNVYRCWLHVLMYMSWQQVTIIILS